MVGRKHLAVSGAKIVPLESWPTERRSLKILRKESINETEVETWTNRIGASGGLLRERKRFSLVQAGKRKGTIRSANHPD